jgi:hypothetical protein
MTLTDYLIRLLGSTRKADVSIYCPLSNNMTSETRIATEETEPDKWIHGEKIAIYECDVCGNRHKFLWGPPTPLYVGDEYLTDGDGDEAVESDNDNGQGAAA